MSDTQLDLNLKRLREITAGAPAPTPEQTLDSNIAKLKDMMFGVEVDLPPASGKPGEFLPEREHVTFPQFAGAVTKEFLSGVGKGLFHPVSAIAEAVGVKFQPGDVERLRMVRNYLMRDDVRGALIESGKDPEFATRVAQAAPGFTGEALGTMAAFAPIFGASKALATPIAKAAKVTAAHERTLEMVGTNIFGATMFSAAAHLDEGESRISRMALDSLFGVAFEGAGFLMLKAGVRKELGRGPYRRLTRSVDEDTVAKVRAGVASVGDAERVLAVAKRDPAIAQTTTGHPSTVVAQARKIVEAHYEYLQPEKWTPTPGLSENRLGYIVTFRTPDGQVQTLPIKTDPVGNVNKTILALRQQKVKLLEVQYGTNGAKTRFENLWVKGEPAKKQKIPNAANPNTGAVRGRPAAGTEVQKNTDQGIVRAVVASPEEIAAEEGRSRSNVPGYSAYDYRTAGVVEPTREGLPPLSEAEAEAAGIRRRVDQAVGGEISKAELEDLNKVRNRPDLEAKLRQQYNEAKTDAERERIDRALNVLRARMDPATPKQDPSSGFRYGAKPLLDKEGNIPEEWRMGIPAQHAVWVKSQRGDKPGFEVWDIRETQVMLPKGAPDRITPANHALGVEQRFALHLNDNSVDWEGIDTELDSSKNWFRSEFFDNVDPEDTYFDTVRGSVKDGRVTLSLPTTYEEMVPNTGGYRVLMTPDEGANVSMHYGDTRQGPYIGGRPEPQDVEWTLIGKAAPEYEWMQLASGEWVPNKYKPIRDVSYINKGSQPQVEDSKGTTLVVRRLRRSEDGKYVKPKGEGALVQMRNRTTGEVERVPVEIIGRRTGETTDLSRSRRRAGKERYGVDKAEPARQRRVHRTATDEIVEGEADDLEFDYGIDYDVDPDTGEQVFLRDDALRVSEPETKFQPFSMWVPKGVHQDFPEMARFKRAAQALKKQGLPGETPVALHISNEKYDVAVGVTHDWTLDDIVNVQMGEASRTAMKREAEVRGLRVEYEGLGASIVTSDGTKIKFPNTMEAYEAIVRVPVTKNGPKLEKEIERMLGLGSDRAYDADLDIDQFRPAQLQELATGELFSGKRPLISVYTTKPAALEASIRKLELNAGIKPGTFRVNVLSKANDGERSFATVYNPTAVVQAISPVRGLLADSLGVTGKEADTIVAQLANVPHGLDIVSGRDVFDSAYYAYLRKKGEKERWMQGAVQWDAVGPYRSYGPANPFRGGEAMPPVGPDNSPMDLADVTTKTSTNALTHVPDRPADIRDTPLYDEVEESLREMRALEIERRVDEEYGLAKVDKPGLVAGIGKFFRIPQYLWQDRQAATNVPFFDWFTAIELGRDDMERMQRALFQTRRELRGAYTKTERELGTAVFEHKMKAEAGEVNVLDQMKVQYPPKALEYAEKYEEAWWSFFKDEVGWDRERFAKFWGDDVSKIRANDGDFMAVLSHSPIPRPSNEIFRQLKTGEVRFDAFETDGDAIMKKVARAFASKKYLEPTWNQVSTSMTSLARNGKISASDFTFFTHYMREVLHMPDAVQVTLAQGMKNTVSRIVDVLAKRWPGLRNSALVNDAEALDIVASFSAANTMANMAFQPGMTMRNFIGAAQIIYTLGDPAAATSALKWTARLRKDPATLKWLEGKRVVIRDPIAEASAAMGEIVTGGSKSKLAQGTEYLMEKGMGMYKSTDDFTRIWAYRTQWEGMEMAEKALKDGSMTIDEYLKRTNVDALGPVVKQNVRESLEVGNYEEAKSYASWMFMRSTNFVYSRGNVPRFMQGTLGRLFGQYGTWPMWYVNNMANGAKLLMESGNRGKAVEFIAKWTAINAATFATMEEAFGVDFTRWSWFAPVGYRGGPLFNIAEQSSYVIKTAVSGEEDPVARIQAERLKADAWRQFIPLPTGAVRTTMRTVEDLADGNWKDAMRTFLTLPEAKEQ